MMEKRTFRAPDMMAALEKVQGQLGPDALVLSVREVFDESIWKVWKRPGVEVLAARNEGETGDPESPNKSVKDIVKFNRREDEPAPGSKADLEQESPRPNGLSGAPLASPAARLEERQPQPREAAGKGSLSTPLEEFRKEFSRQGIADSLLDMLFSTCRDVLPGQVLKNRNRVKNYLGDLLEAEIEVMPELKFARTGVVCMIGTGGAGKTSTLAKLGAKYAQQGSPRTAWVTADTIRGGAIAEAQAYTDSLEIPFSKAYSPEEFGDMVEDLREDYLVLADLFDCNPRRTEDLERLELYLEEVSPRETYLILPATAKLGDIQHLLEAFEPVEVSGLIATKLDETGSIGNIISAVWASRLPLVYESRGPRAADPLQQPDPARLSRQVIESLSCPSRSTRLYE